MDTETLGRNDPCHCGSGKKYKKCCMAKDEAKEHATLEKQWTENEKKMKASAEAEAEKAKDHPQAQTKQKPTSQVTEHKHNTIAAPKFNMPRRTGGG